MYYDDNIEFSNNPLRYLFDRNLNTIDAVKLLECGQIICLKKYHIINYVLYLF